MNHFVGLTTLQILVRCMLFVNDVVRELERCTQFSTLDSTVSMWTQVPTCYGSNYRPHMWIIITTQLNHIAVNIVHTVQGLKS